MGGGLVVLPIFLLLFLILIPLVSFWMSAREVSAPNLTATVVVVLGVPAIWIVIGGVGFGIYGIFNSWRNDVAAQERVDELVEFAEESVLLDTPLGEALRINPNECAAGADITFDNGWRGKEGVTRLLIDTRIRDEAVRLESSGWNVIRKQAHPLYRIGFEAQNGEFAIVVSGMRDGAEVRAVDLECATSRLNLSEVDEFDRQPFFSTNEELLAAQEEITQYLRDAGGPDERVWIDPWSIRRKAEFEGIEDGNPQTDWCSVVGTVVTVNGDVEGTLRRVPIEEARSGLEEILLADDWNIRRGEWDGLNDTVSWGILAERDGVLELLNTNFGVRVTWYPPGCITGPIEVPEYWRPVEQFGDS